MKKEDSTDGAPIFYINRESGEQVRESVMGNNFIRFAYETALGHSLWGLLFNRSFLSDIMGWFYDSGLSKCCIGSLIKVPGLNAAEAEKPVAEYRSFNDFFARKLKAGSRPANPNGNVLITPADGRLLVYPALKADDAIPVKGAKYTLRHLCGELPAGGSYCVAIVRLAPVDYHRYHFPCDCRQLKASKRFEGKYHSVNPIALKRVPDLFVENTRQVTVLESNKFGVLRFIEVGAFGVGSIQETASGTEFLKMNEKGYFKFGGSTVILVLDADKVKFDEDLLKNSANGQETFVRCGSGIASIRP